MLASSWQWLLANETLLWWLGILSLVMFIGTLLLVPVLVARIPADYFSGKHHHQKAMNFAGRHPILRLGLLILKNLLGVILVLAGLAMLVLPGQGILTMVIGLMLMNFPGKFALEQRLVRQPVVLKAINWMRTRSGKPPLQIAAVESNP